MTTQLPEGPAMTGPSTGPEVSPNGREVLLELARLGRAADVDIAEGLPHRNFSSVSAARVKLVHQGYVRQAGTKQGPGKRKVKIWEVVPEDEREEARKKAQTRKPEWMRALRSRSPDEQAAAIRWLLRQPAVSRAVLASQDRAGRQARGATRREWQTIKDERRMRRQQERDRNDRLEFRKLSGIIVDNVEALRGVETFLDRELQRRVAGEPLAIPLALWPPVAALAAGVSIFELARLLGTSVRMIDRTYGHLARDSEDAIRAKLDARASRSGGEVALNADDDNGL
jgi:hypothetical protein